MKPEIILIGGGGHCKSCIDVIEQQDKFKISGIVDVKDKLHRRLLGYEIIATDDDLPALVKEYRNFHIAIGQIKDPAPRIKLFQILKRLSVNIPEIISPKAHVSPHAIVGEGSIIMHHALVNAGAKIGNNCIVNTKTLIEHDATIEDYCHVATAAVINGGCSIGKGAFIGSNVVCRESISIGEFSVVGCGVKLVENVDSYSLVVK